MYQILTETDTISKEFEASSKDVNSSLILSGFQTGNAWELQVEAPDGTWIGTGVEFTANGIESGLVFTAGLKYRLTGGSAGAKAWISDFA